MQNQNPLKNGKLVYVPHEPEKTISDGELTAFKLHDVIQFHLGSPTARQENVYEKCLLIFRKELLSQVMKRCAYNQLRAARMLGINRNTLRKYLTECEIEFGIDLKIRHSNS